MRVCCTTQISALQRRFRRCAPLNNSNFYKISACDKCNVWTCLGLPWTTSRIWVSLDLVWGSFHIYFQCFTYNFFVITILVRQGFELNITSTTIALRRLLCPSLLTSHIIRVLFAPSLVTRTITQNRWPRVRRPYYCNKGVPTLIKQIMSGVFIVTFTISIY